MEEFRNFFSISGASLVTYLPIGIIGIWRWSVWLMKKSLSLFYRPPSEKYLASLSVITPVYNEDPKIFRLALESWKANRPEEIIAVIDYTDKKCIAVFQKFKKNFKGAKLIVTKTPGKRAALADGIKASASEIVALVDSDTVWTKNIKKKLVAPFGDEKVGGVAPRQDVMEVDTLAKKLFRIHLFNRYGNELIFQAAMGNALSCISGRTGVYRRSAIADLTDDLVNEKFLGLKCISGDDKCLTNLIQRRKWKVKYLKNVLVYTPGFPDVATYTKQQIRWTRNSWRADLTSVFSTWLWRNPFLAFSLLDRFVQPFTLLLGPVYFIISIIRGDWIITLILLVWWLLSRAAKIAPHLAKHPKDFLVLPVYILYCYLLAVIRIYTLFTVRWQSWITRWNEKRMGKIIFLKKIPPLLATGFVIAALFTIGQKSNQLFPGLKIFSQNARSNSAKKENIIRVENESALVPLAEDEILSKMKAFEEKVNGDPFGYYQVRSGDTLSSIRRKYFLSPSAVIYDGEKNPVRILGAADIGKRIAIPVENLRDHDFDSSYKNNPGNRNRLMIAIDPDEDALRIKGLPGTIATLSQIYQTVGNRQMIERLGNREWILRKNLYIDEGVTLFIDGEEAKWLKLKSDEEGFCWIKSEGGNIVINQAKITSWDEKKDDFDLNLDDGRSYILQKSSGRMDISDSELAYLGHIGLPQRGNPFGGPYGISWKILDGSFRDELVTGSLISSEIHDNFFGAYTFGATGIVFRDNDVYNNIEYGIDPHDDSNNLLIENNRVFRNGNHGIIASRNCFNNTIKGNNSSNNKLHGIMLDRDSNNNLISENNCSGNINGIALYHSSGNLIMINSLFDNQFSIRANSDSDNNFFVHNLINASKKGIFLYDSSSDNYIYQNVFMNTETGVHLKEKSTGFTSEDNRQEILDQKAADGIF